MGYAVAAEASQEERWAHIAEICRSQRVGNLSDTDSGRHVANMPDYRLPADAAGSTGAPRFLYLFDLLEGGFVHGILTDRRQTAESLFADDQAELERFDARYPDGAPEGLEAIDEPCVPQAIFDTETGQLIKGEL